MKKAGDDFVLPGLKYVFAGLSRNINPLMEKDSYFVTKIRIDEYHEIFFRLSENAVDILLDKSLGRANGKFNINKLTDLESKIITGFNDYMYHIIIRLLSPTPPTVKRKNYDVIHLTFFVTDEERRLTGKFIITVPEILIQPDNIECIEDNFSNEDFYANHIAVDLQTGVTRLRVIDLKNIEIDDIVVLDDSNIAKWLLKYKDFEFDVNLEPNSEIILPYEINNEGDNEMADKVNLWDSIEVDLVAHFDGVKISLGELKKIQQGLVMDVSPIYQNKVTLSVEDKDIAYGELVIVNDRYGVKVNELVAGAAESASEAATDAYVQQGAPAQPNTQDAMPPQPAEGQEVQQPQEQIPQAGTDEEEEFDYSDFELEDEDI